MPKICSSQTITQYDPGCTLYHHSTPFYTYLFPSELNAICQWHYLLGPAYSCQPRLVPILSFSNKSNTVKILQKTFNDIIIKNLR